MFESALNKVGRSSSALGHETSFTFRGPSPCDTVVCLKTGGLRVSVLAGNLKEFRVPDDTGGAERDDFPSAGNRGFSSRAEMLF
jgi:hypothetical protein